MAAPTISAYSDTSITISWTPLAAPNNGNSDILSYSLKWNTGDGSAPSIELTNVLTTSYVVSGITAGTAYKFSVRARNIYGYSSAESPVTTANAVNPPGKMDIPTVALDGTTPTSVDITWTVPTLTHGSAVDAYDVQFKTASGTYVNDASCNPAAASA
jgi:hypothetical protein